MGVTVLFYKLFQFQADLAAILKSYCCHGNVTYKFIPQKIVLLISGYSYVLLTHYSQSVKMSKSASKIAIAIAVLCV